MNKLIDIVKRYGITGCLYKIILRIGGLFGITYIKYLTYFKSLPPAIDADTLPPYHRLTMNDFKMQVEFSPQWFDNHKLNQIEKLINEPRYAYYGIYEGKNLHAMADFL